jgi:GntR family transcriptional regulator
MFMHIDPSDELAIYDQIVRQIKFAIAGGALAPGDLAPSVRELARDLTINPNTVARAYQQLQAEQLLQTVRGTGLAVAQSAPKRCREERLTLIQTRLRQAIAEAKSSGLEESTINDLIASELASEEG